MSGAIFFDLKVNLAKTKIFLRICQRTSSRCKSDLARLRYSYVVGNGGPCGI